LAEEVIDLQGLDAMTLNTLMGEECKVELVLQWIHLLTVDGQTNGVVVIAPPILSRIFQNLSNMLNAFYGAYRLTEIPYPFPYKQTTELLLLTHCIITPMVMCDFTSEPGWTAFFSFALSLILISLNSIAHELEDPFGDDSNDLNLKEMQHELNKRLLMLMAPATQLVPEPSPSACDLSVQTGRRPQPETRAAVNAAAPTLTTPLRENIPDVDLVVLTHREQVLAGVPAASKDSPIAAKDAFAAASKDVGLGDDSSDLGVFFPNMKGSPAPSRKGADLPAPAPDGRLRPDLAAASGWAAPAPPKAATSAPTAPSVQVPSTFGARHSAPPLHASPASMQTRGPSSDTSGKELASQGSSVSTEQATPATALLQK